MVKKRRQPASEEATLTKSLQRTAVSLAVAAALPGAMMVPNAAMAQEDDAIEEIVTYGKFRRSQVDAINTKRVNTGIVEAISAEDIGKLPDSSIAESLARLPGLAGERVNGRVSGISVRGFKEDYTAVTMNGRELLGIGDNRGVEYDLYPSEIISGAVVYKTPNATHVHQGIAGIVDLRTIRPLDDPEHLVINANYEVNELESANPDFDDDGYRVALSYADAFADNTIGLALTVATTESPSQEVQFRGWGYASVGCDDQGNFNNATDMTGGELQCGDAILGGHDSFVRSASLERDTFSGILQFAPSDNMTLTFDALYIDFVEDKVFRGIEDGGPEWGGTAYTVTDVDNGLVTGGYYEGFHSVVRNDAERKDAELTTFGLNLDWDLGDNWSFVADAAISETDKTVTNIESYSGVGRANLNSQGPQTPRSWQMTPDGAIYGPHPTLAPVDLSDFDVVRLAGPQSWGGGMQNLEEFAEQTLPDGSVIGPFQAQDGFINEPVFDEELTTIKLEAFRALDAGFLSGLTFGVYYSDREKTKDNGGYYLTAPTWPSDDVIPENFRMGVTDLSDLGLGNMVAYDGLGMFSSGFYTSSDAALLQPDREGDSYTIQEELTTAYAMVDIDSNIGNMILSGNFGLQYVGVDQKGIGVSSFIGESGFVETVDASDGTDYSDVLPSLNLSLEVAEGHFVRFAAAKTVSRPRMDQMKPNNQVNFNFNFANVSNPNPVNGPWSGNAGNARLKPLEANQVDLFYDWYFADDGFVSGGYFYKDLTNWHADGSFIADFTPFYVPGYHQAIDPDTGEVVEPATFLGVVTAQEDGLEGFVKGWEFQANMNFNVFTSSLDGLGIIAAAALYDGELDNGQAVPGLSDESYQATLYYERGGFQARVSWTRRSEFSTETPQLSLALTPTVDQGGELVDAQIGYDFGLGGSRSLDGLFISLQAQNITDEKTLQTNNDAREVTKWQTFGSNYLLNVNYRFK